MAIGEPENPMGWVKLASIKGGKIRVMFEMPREVKVNREDVVRRILVGTPKAGG